jgi:hypothetical protein
MGKRGTPSQTLYEVRKIVLGIKWFLTMTAEKNNIDCNAN